MNMLTVLNVFQVIFLTEKHELPARRVLSNYAGDCSTGKMANVLQDGRVRPLYRFSGLEDIFGRDGDELKSITLVIDLNRSHAQTGLGIHAMYTITNQHKCDLQVTLTLVAYAHVHTF